MTTPDHPDHARRPDSAAKSNRAHAATKVARFLGPLVGLLGVFFVGRTLFEERADLVAAFTMLRTTELLLALVLAVLAMGLIGLGWKRILRSYGVQSNTGSIMRWYFTGQLGKYIPGGIWPIVGRSELAHRGGVDRAIGYASTLTSLAATYSAAALVGITALLTYGTIGTVAGVGIWSVTLALVATDTGHSMQRRIAGTLSLRRIADAQPVNVTLLVLHIVPWVIGGLAVSVVARSLSGSSPVSSVIAIHSLAWLAGFMAIGVPGGIGVREAVFVGLSGGVMNPSNAALVAVIARLLFVLVDVISAAMFQALKLLESR